MPFLPYEGLVLDDVRFTVLWLMHDVPLRRQCFDERGASMGWVGVVNNHVLSFAGLSEIKYFLVSSVGGKRELLDWEVDVDALTVDVDGSLFEKATSARVPGLIAGKENRIFNIMTESVEVPKSRSAFQHA